MGRGLDGYFYPAVLCGFQAPPRARARKIPVAHSEGETPLPIPNRAVKPLSADGTWRATSWESRSPPVLPWFSDRAAERRPSVDCDRVFPDGDAAERTAAAPGPISRVYRLNTRFTE